MHTNPAITKELKRTSIFANWNSVGGSVGLLLQCPKMQSDSFFILLRQHFGTAQFHQIASTLVDVKLNIFFSQRDCSSRYCIGERDSNGSAAHTWQESVTAFWILQHDLEQMRTCNFWHLNELGRPLASNSDQRIQHGSVRLLDNGYEIVIIHVDEALVTNHSTGLKWFQTQICLRMQSSVAPISRCQPMGGHLLKTCLLARSCAQGLADATRNGQADRL